jgi:hypothetical protein
MDERDMEEEGKEREKERWGIGIIKAFFGIYWNCYFIFICLVYYVYRCL